MSPRFVLDASVALAWCFTDEIRPATELILDRLRAGEPGAVPAHWPTEVMNGLLMASRRGRITAEEIEGLMTIFSRLPIEILPPYEPSRWNRVLQLAARYHLTVYDAAYLELANLTGLPLATLDRELIRAAAAEDVELLG